MKKLLSLLLSAAMLASLVGAPAFADEADDLTTQYEQSNTFDDISRFDYAKCDYDIERYKLDYEADGTTTNTIDSSKALQVTERAIVLSPSDASWFTKEFYLSFDFRFDTAADESVSGLIAINKLKSSGADDKIGPNLFYDSDSGQLVTDTGKTPQALGAISPDTWYTLEMEGKMSVPGAAVNLNLYQYADGQKTLVQTTNGLNLRQFYAGTSNGNPTHMTATNVSLDNVLFISEFPDTLTLASTTDLINAGASAKLDYTAFRQEKEVTKHAVTWSVYDQANENEITDGSVSINDQGLLAADIASPTQTVTVRATVNFGGDDLIGTYPITINAVDVSGEKFDKIEISGETEIKAGTSTPYTFTAYKDNADVSDTLEPGDVQWKVYNYENLLPNENIAFELSDDGVLTVADGTIAQNITLRAMSPSGNVFASLPISIGFSDSQTEAVLASDACEVPVATADSVASWDKSQAYFTTAQTVLCNFGNTSKYVLTELDVKFTGNNSGFTLLRADGTQNSGFRYYEGSIAMQTGSSNYKPLTPADTDTWYHFEILYTPAFSSTPEGTLGNASCNIYAYDADGNLGEKIACLDISTRNHKDYGKIQIESATYTDNIKISTPIPDAVTLKAENAKMFIGDTNKITATASRNGLPIFDTAGLKWSVLDSEGYAILDESITISDAGILSVSQTATAQNITVVASASEEIQGRAPVEILSRDFFEITNIGVNEEKTKITKLYMNMKFYYTDKVAFIIAIYDADGTLKGAAAQSGYGDSYRLGENEVNFNYALPANFNPDTDKITAFAWTSL